MLRVGLLSEARSSIVILPTNAEQSTNRLHLQDLQSRNPLCLMLRLPCRCLNGNQQDAMRPLHPP